jgi:transcriptional regulator with XRE-family HTH domain
MSPEQLGWATGVSGHTIRRIERMASIPTPRVQYALAKYFELRPTELWLLDARKAAA